MVQTFSPPVPGFDRFKYTDGRGDDGATVAALTAAALTAAALTAVTVATVATTDVVAAAMTTEVEIVVPIGVSLFADITARLSIPVVESLFAPSSSLTSPLSLPPPLQPSSRRRRVSSLSYADRH